LLRKRLRARAAVVGVALGLGALAPVVAAPPAFCAGEGPRAVLVVDRENGSASLRMCVALPDNQVSGLELIELAGDQYDLQYRFGHGGAAVCQLANVPAERPPADCLQQGKPFWGYWRDRGGGGWQWSGSGAGSTSVSDGDVEGWSFGFGNDGGSHPQPPSTRPSDVCRPVRDGGGSGGGAGKDDRAGKSDGRNRRPRPDNSKPAGGKGGSEPAGGGDSTSGTPGAPGPSNEGLVPEGPKHSRKGRGPASKGDEGRDAREKAGEKPGSGVGKSGDGAPAPIDLPSSSPSALPANATSADDDSSSGIPVMGFIALGAALVMGIAAIVTTRRPTTRSSRPLARVESEKTGPKKGG
jgi:hypothetical protein